MDFLPPPPDSPPPSFPSIDEGRELETANEGATGNTEPEDVQRRSKNNPKARSYLSDKNSLRLSKIPEPDF